MSCNLEVALLRTFVAVADHGSMTTASNSLHLTQSAVSQQVARLENLAGPLFVRGRRRVRLTAAGERLLPRARGVVAAKDELWGEMAPETLRAAIRLGAPPDLAGNWLPPVLRGFTQAHCLVKVALTCAASPGLLDAAAAGTPDLVLAEEQAGAQVSARAPA